nr:hypothetical protein [Candidatus Sigynarchaeota archaeon]
MLLDVATEYLCGPWFGFSCNDQFHLFKNCDKENPYELLNLKVGKTVTRLTVQFGKKTAPMNNNAIDVKARFYADVYFCKEHLYCLFFFSIKNVSADCTFKNLHVYNLFDFDIGGLNFYDTDSVYFDKQMQAIVQYDGDVHVGFASIPEFPVSHFAGGHPYELTINAEHQSLSDTILEGPDDFFSGLQWDFGDLEPGQCKILPVIIAAGESKEEFEANLAFGIARARRMHGRMQKIIELPERQVKASDGLIEKIEKMNETWKSMKKNVNC